MRDPIIIAGPTASGKSSLALALAKALGEAVIINADSIQLYRDLQILTTRPAAADFLGVRHYLYGVLSAEASSSAAWWQQETLKILRSLPNTQPIIVGGTGLYLASLTQGLAEIPPIPEAIRTAVRQKLQTMGLAAFTQWVLESDPLLKVSDSQRLSRALEVKLATGQSIVTFQQRTKAPLSAYRFITLLPPRDLLYQRINQRFVRMIENGALKEVELLKTVPATAPLRKALGVQEALDYLEGKLTLEAAIVKAQQASRRYAKRQITWLRHQAPQDIMIETVQWKLDTVLGYLNYC